MKNLFTLALLAGGGLLLAAPAHAQQSISKGMQPPGNGILTTTDALPPIIPNGPTPLRGDMMSASALPVINPNGDSTEGGWRHTFQTEDVTTRTAATAPAYTAGQN